MKNIINYYYGFNIVDIYNINNAFYFNYNNYNYIFLLFDRRVEETNSIYKLYLELKKRNIFTNDIIINKDNQLITFVNNIPYILIRDNTKNKLIDLNDILYIQNNTYNIINDKSITRNDWTNLWQLKIDYYEGQIDDISRKYTLIGNTIDYYIGLGENAISYLVYNEHKNNNYVLSHRELYLKNNSFSFYNPVNYILDSRVRDFAEYIKIQFFTDKLDFNLFSIYLNYLNFNKSEYIELISRLLFPTYYFDLLDEIIVNNENENIIKNVLDKNKDYLLFLKNTFNYIVYTKKINIPFIEWIIKY